MSTKSRPRVNVLERLLVNNGFEVNAVTTPSGGRSVVAYDPKLGRAYVLVDEAAHTVVDAELRSELRWVQRLANRIPQDELPTIAAEALSTGGTRGQYSHLVLEAAVTFGWERQKGPAQRLLPEVVVDTTTGTILDWNVSPGSAGAPAGSRRSIDLVALREGVTVAHVVKGTTRIQDVAAASIDYKTGNARLTGASELRELTGAPVVRLARGGQLDDQLSAAVNLMAPPHHDAPRGPAPDVLVRHPGLSPEARAALNDGHVQYAVSNAAAGVHNAAFSSAVFSRGYVALDIVTGGFLSSMWEFNHARRAFAISGQRGFATVGGMTFSLAAVGGLVFAVKDITDFDDAVDFVAENATVGAGALLIGRLTGSAAIGVIGGFILTMESDQGAPTEEDLRQERVEMFLRQNFSTAEIAAGGDDLRHETYALLFETIPMILSRGPTSDGSQVGNMTMHIVGLLEADLFGPEGVAEHLDALTGGPTEQLLSALINIMRLHGAEQMRDMLQQKWHPRGGTYYDALLDWLKHQKLDGLADRLPSPETEEPPAPDPDATNDQQTVPIPRNQWAHRLPDGSWITRRDFEECREEDDGGDESADNQDDIGDDDEASAPSWWQRGRQALRSAQHDYTDDGDEPAPNATRATPPQTVLPAPASAEVSTGGPSAAPAGPEAQSAEVVPASLLLPDGADMKPTAPGDEPDATHSSAAWMLPDQDEICREQAVRNGGAEGEGSTDTDQPLITTDEPVTVSDDAQEQTTDIDDVEHAVVLQQPGGGP